MWRATWWSISCRHDGLDPGCEVETAGCPGPAQNGAMEHIALVGAMGAGKTTIGREVARRLGRPFLDSDSALEGRHGETAADLATREGVGRLHDIELDIFDDLTDSAEASVIAPAASVIDSAEGRTILSRNLTIWLDAPEQVLALRRDRSDHRRELQLEELTELEERRRPFWESTAVVRIENSGTVDDVVEGVLEAIRRIEADQNSS